jgi:hypothetical protein
MKDPFKHFQEKFGVIKVDNFGTYEHRTKVKKYYDDYAKFKLGFDARDKDLSELQKKFQDTSKK